MDEARIVDIVRTLPKDMRIEILVKILEILNRRHALDEDELRLLAELRPTIKTKAA